MSTLKLTVLFPLPQGPSAGRSPASPQQLAPPFLCLQPLSLFCLYSGGASGHRPVPSAHPQNSPQANPSLGSTGPAVDRASGADDWGPGGAVRLARKWRTSSSFGSLLLLTEFLHFLELASDAALPANFYFFTLISFWCPGRDLFSEGAI